MKTMILKFSAIIASFILAITTESCKKEDLPPNDNIVTSLLPRDTVDTTELSTANYQSQVNACPKQSLSTDELNSLIYMREEEKLARDIYQFFYKKYNMPIFYNISQSEQIHMDAVLSLLNKYEIQDPVGTNGAGVFTNPIFTGMYTDLLNSGNTLLNALKAGAGIEDLDIYDLQNAIKLTDNQDITFVYSNLKKASGNHLRAFYKNILRLGGSYTPQYITPDEFNTIVSTQ